MSITRRLVDLAKANLNALLDKAGDGGIDGLSDEELEAELERRRERRRREEAEQRARYSAEEAARTRAAERAQQAGKARGANGERDGAAASGRNGASSRAQSSSSRSSARDQQRSSPSSLPLGDKKLRELYAQLEVPFGAPFEEVKKSFRRLMRKYHPDLHVGNPQKHATATQLTMSLTQAYNELEQHLTRGRHA